MHQSDKIVFIFYDDNIEGHYTINNNKHSFWRQNNINYQDRQTVEDTQEVMFIDLV